MAESIKEEQEEGIGKVLWDKYGENINLCTSLLQENTPTNPSQEERFSQTNRYKPSKCNVGTNFKSGVSIEKENHAFVIILPPLGAKKPFQNMYGIFSDGINSVIQAIARQRKKGEIHMILPPPAKFDFNSLPFKEDGDKKEAFKSFYELCYHHGTNLVEYHSLNEQDSLIKDYYDNVILENIEEEIKVVEELDRRGLASLKFPNYKDYKLANGEKYLVKTYPFFGGDLSAYVLYCAITNQFLNCKFAGGIFKAFKEFHKGKVQDELNYYYMDYTADAMSYGITEDDLDFSSYYLEFHTELFRNYKILLDRQPISAFENKYLEQQILVLLQRKFFHNSDDLRDRYVDTNDFSFIDVEYTRGEYFRNCIAYAQDLNYSHMPENERDLVRAYLKLDEYRQKLIDSATSINIRNEDILYINKTNSNFISPEEIEDFNNMITTISEKDLFINKEIFDFKKLLSLDNQAKVKRFYTYLKQDFLKVKTRKIQGTDYDQILSTPEDNQGIHFIINSNDSHTTDIEETDEGLVPL